ncbi:Bug family tripartite tricarboxylate transporter substrate binding protein [Roseomonas sp. BN140053]|uniref:Bug family tripartite tricarboxylate transporter substrate binding protein n=1 Tax=Roseomonas sp. BN140053 TaxID=3391898 RepID=UPI0039EC5463
MIARRPLLGLGLAAAGLASAARPARAQEWPNRPLRLVVAFTPGGPSDVLARIIGQRVTQELGQTVVIENRPGAGGNVAAEVVAKSPPDGYTLLMANNSILAANAFLYRSIPYDPIRDFVPVTLVGAQPNILVVNPAVPARSVPELIALAKAQPGTLNYASSGSGTAAHLAGELFRLRAGVEIVHVAYRGAAPALNDLIDGRVQMMFATSASVMNFIRERSLCALAVTATTRSPAVPDLPTVAEAALPGFDAATWHGIVMPAGVPEPLVNRLDQALATTLADRGVREKLDLLGVEEMRSTPARFATYIREEADRWGGVIRSAGLHAE